MTKPVPLPLAQKAFRRPLTRVREENTQLTYRVSTSPSPLQASPSAPAALTEASLTVIASNQGRDTVGVQEIRISFDIAEPSNPDDATYLTSVGNGIDAQMLGDPEQKIWTVDNPGDGSFTFRAVGDSVPVLEQGLAVLLSGIKPNRSVGTFQLTITEILADGSAPADTTIELSKFPYAFYLDDFGPDVPTVNYGGTTTLRWHGGTGADLELLYGDVSVDVTNKSFWVTPPLLQDVSFLLRARIGDLALAILSTEVQVANPDVAGRSLTINGSSALNGPVTAAQLQVNAEADFQGPVAARGGMGVSGGLAVRGDIMLSGNLAIDTPGKFTALVAIIPWQLKTGYLCVADEQLPGPPPAYLSRFETSLNRPAISAVSTSSCPTISAKNYGSGGTFGMGVYADVGAGAWGLCSNGHIATTSGSGHLTHLETRNGYRVVTSPFCASPEIHISGCSRLVNGRADVVLDQELADMIAADGSYRVLLTPLGPCGALYVTAKDAQGFRVQAEGDSAEEFDWLVIAPTRTALTATMRAALPEKLFAVPEPAPHARPPG